MACCLGGKDDDGRFQQAGMITAAKPRHRTLSLRQTVTSGLPEQLCATPASSVLPAAVCVDKLCRVHGPPVLNKFVAVMVLAFSFVTKQGNGGRRTKKAAKI
jgi:hypothetical protein